MIRIGLNIPLSQSQVVLCMACVKYLETNKRKWKKNDLRVRFSPSLFPIYPAGRTFLFLIVRTTDQRIQQIGYLTHQGSHMVLNKAAHFRKNPASRTRMAGDLLMVVTADGLLPALSDYKVTYRPSPAFNISTKSLNLLGHAFEMSCYWFQRSKQCRCWI